MGLEDRPAIGGFIELLDSEEPNPEMELEDWGAPASPPEEFDLMFPTVIQEPSVAFLEWGKGQVADDPTYARHDGCARSPARARGRFARAIREGDENGLLSVYFWRGKSNGSVSSILTRLQNLPVDGQWEGTRVGMWTGVDDVRNKVPTFWRWSDGVSHHYFVMREDIECWLVEFSEVPPEAVEIMPEDNASNASPGLLPSSFTLQGL